jgi:nitroreductase
VLSLVRNRLTRPLVALAVGPSPVRELLDALPGLQRAEERIARGEDPLFHGAPAVLLLHAPRGRETSETDCALAADHLTLYAPSLGFGTCHIGYAAAALKRMPKAARTFGIPAGHCTFAVLTAGYPDVRYARLPPRPPIPLRYS